MQKFTKVAALALPVALLAAAPAAQAENSLEASFRVGLSLVDNDTTENDFRIQNFGSRLKWSGSNEIRSGLNGIAYLEFGFNPDNNSRGSSGVDRTRHAWAGVEGGFGQIKVGAQYASFYDTVSGKTDIAWWGSCWTQFECSRETAVLKYTGSSGPVKYTASIQGDAGDEGNDFADEIELGATFAAGPVSIGLATAIHADDGDDEGGTLVGAVAKGSFGGLGLGLGFQMADSDFAGTADDVTHVTFTGTFGNFYTVINQADGLPEDTGSFQTVGYTLNIGASSLMYFEAQSIDGGDNAGNNTILRATYKYDFGVL